MSYLLMIGSLILICIGPLGTLMYKSEQRRNDKTAEAVIVDVKVLKKRQGNDTWIEKTPVLEYRINGKKYRKEYMTRTYIERWKDADYRIGRKVKIAYSSNAPEFISVVSNECGCGGLWVFTGVGIFGLILSILSM